jgi:hypothetical protein
MRRSASRARIGDSSKHTLFLTILGLVLTALGLIALVELFPRPSVSSGPPTIHDRWLTSRFTVTNDGYFQLNDVRALCFIWRATTSTMDMRDDISRVISPYNLILPPGQGFTVPCESDILRLGEGTYRSVDLAIVVSYRPWPVTIIRQRKFFRLVARLDNGSVIWEKEPSSVMEHEFDLMLNTQPSLSDFRRGP